MTDALPEQTPQQEALDDLIADTNVLIVTGNTQIQQAFSETKEATVLLQNLGVWSSPSTPETLGDGTEKTLKNTIEKIAEAYALMPSVNVTVTEETLAKREETAFMTLDDYTEFAKALSFAETVRQYLLSRLLKGYIPLKSE